MTSKLSMHAACWTWSVGMAVFVGLAGCSRKEEQPVATSPGPSAAAVLNPLIDQYAQIERAEEEEMGGLRDVSAAGFQKEIDVRRQLLDKVRLVSKDGLSLEEDIDRRLMIGMLESSIHSAEARRIWENDPALYVPAPEIGRGLEPTAPGTPPERAAALDGCAQRSASSLGAGQAQCDDAVAQLHGIRDLQD